MTIAYEVAWKRIPESVGAHREGVGFLGLSGTYVPGGFAVDPRNFGLTSIESLAISDYLGYSFEYAATTGIIRATQGAGGSVSSGPFFLDTLADHNHSHAAFVEETHVAFGKRLRHGSVTGGPFVVETVSTPLVVATGSILYGAPANGDTVVVGGVGFLKEAAAGGVQFTNIGELTTLINSMVPSVVATNDGVTVSLTAATGGAAGNAITLSNTGAGLTVSGPTLTGGADQKFADVVSLETANGRLNVINPIGDFVAGDVITGGTSGASATLTCALLEYWVPSNNFSIVPMVVTAAGNPLQLVDKNGTISTGRAVVVYAMSQIETLSSDSFGTLFISYLKNTTGDASGGTPSGSVSITITPSAETEVVAGTSMAALNAIPFIVRGI